MEVLSSFVFWSPSGGVPFLHDSIDEFVAGDKLHDLLVAVQASPFFLCHLGQLEDHREARDAGRRALGAAVALSHGREG